MPPKGSSKRKAAEALPAAEAVPAAEPAAAEESTGRRSGRSAAKPQGSYGGPIPRGPKKAKTTEEKDAVTADAPAASAEVNTNPADEKEAAPEESKAEEPAPVADEQVTKVAEEVPDKAQEAAAQATPDVAVETKGAVSSGAVEVGSMIPLDVTLKTDEDKEVSVKDLVAEKGAVFFLYPKANTPGCTTQACGFRDNYAEFKTANFEVYGISMDNPKPLATWKTKQNFGYTLLSDPKQVLIKALGGSKTVKTVTRSHFVVEKGGKLLLASIGVKPAESQKAALEFVKAL